MIGLKFGRWKVINSSELRTPAKTIQWVCECECGTVKLVTGNSLRMGKTKSCGCLKYDRAKLQFVKHGHENERGKSPKIEA